MGKKLSYWEKASRESAKRSQRAAGKARMASQKRETSRRNEAERVKRANAAASRRSAEKRERESKKLAEQKVGKNNGENFLNLMEGLANYVKILNKFGYKLPNGKSFEFSGSISKLKYPGDFSSKDSMPEIELSDFNPNKAIRKLTTNKNMTYDVFKSKYGTFFGNLFGSTKKLYGPFVLDNESKFNSLKEKEDKRKEDFKIALNNYLEYLKKHNKSIKEKEIKDNKNRVENFDKLVESVDNYNKVRTSLVKKINKAFDSIKEPDFESLFSINLPIKFELLDSFAKQLKSKVPNLSSDFYKSPNTHFKYGINTAGKELELFLSYEEDFFPLPSNQQVNIISSGSSVVQLSKTNKTNIEKNIVPNICLLYAQYAYSTIGSLDKFNMYIGKNTHDKVTGAKIVDWSFNLSFNKSDFQKLNFKNIIPFETLKLFANSSQNIPDNVKWFGSRKSSNKFSKEIDSLEKLFDKTLIEIDDLKNDKFKYPEKTELNKLKSTANKIAGVMIKSSVSKKKKNPIKKLTTEQQILKKYGIN